MAVLTFKLQLPKSFNETAIKNFKINGKGLYDTRVLNLEAPKEPYFEWKQGTENSINLSFEGKLPIVNNVLTVSMFVFPSKDVKTIELSLTDGAGIEYTAQINSINELEAAVRYKINVNMDKTPIQKALEEQELTVASIFTAKGNFLGRYVINSDDNTLNLTYFDGRTLKHLSRSLNSKESDISFDAVSLSSEINLTGFTLKDKAIQLEGTGIATCALISQKNAIKEMGAIGNIDWNQSATCANGYTRTTYGDAKDEFNNELANNLYTEFIRFEKGSYSFFSCGISKHGDVRYNNACNSLTELCKSGEIDIIQFELNNVSIGYSGNGTFPGFTDAENKAHEAPQRYLEKVMPKTLEAWAHKDGLIVVKEVVDEKTSFYLLSPTTDSWFKFIKK